MDSSKDYLAKLQYIKEIYSELKKSQDLLSKNIIQPSKHERKKRKFWCKLENTIRDIPLKVRKTDQFEVEIKNGSDSSLKSSSKSQLEKSKHSPTQKIPSVSNYQSEANEDGNNICGIIGRRYSHSEKSDYPRSEILKIVKLRPIKNGL